MFTFHCDICQNTRVSLFAKSISVPTKALSQGIGAEFRRYDDHDASLVNVRMCADCYRLYHTYLQMVNSLRPAIDYHIEGAIEYLHESAESAALQALTFVQYGEPSRHVPRFNHVLRVEQFPENKADILFIEDRGHEWTCVRTKPSQFMAWLWYP